MKVVGVGLGKTGTSTLGAALRKLGYKHKTHDPVLFDQLHRGNKQACIEGLSRFESFDDFPWNILYKDIDREYPRSKFVLTVRKDAETWYRSLCEHWDRTGNSVSKRHAYGYMCPYEEHDYHIALYERHIADVTEYFSGRPEQLLVVCWEHGDGWAALCEFLDVAVPKIAFPHANKTPQQAVFKAPG